jgi:predicted dehydrogenase/threonine dehydrogenase-like Zn-dependent dehydrogenase
MKQVLIKQGGIAVEDTPEPMCGFGRLLVRVEHSCVSPGTELVSVKSAQMPLWKRALKQREHVRRVVDMVRQSGLRATIAKVQGRLGGGAPTGYSAAGVVEAVGDGVEGFNVGDRVACAGAGLANHAGWVEVPMNLCVRIPEGVETSQAATVTLGAIALQGVRRAEPTLGETVLVVGLGALGLLAVQMLLANGCQVLGSDPDPDRRELGRRLGLAACFDPLAEDVATLVAIRTEGHGADAVLVTASGASDGIISDAFKASRRKGRVVLVGDVGLSLKRGDFYAKEIDFRISCSYGPGRYDPDYEEAGLDYPRAYVRWTENRNMRAYLDLVATGRLKLEPLIGRIFPVESAKDAYAALQSPERPPMVLLSYGEAKARRRAEGAAPKVDAGTGARLALVGAGSFAQGVHLPILRRLGGPWSLRAVMSRTGSTAKSIADQYGAAYATTELEQVLQDPDVDWLLVCSRHQSHGGQVLQGLRAGKSVFVEKPLCLGAEELEAIRSFYEAPGPKPQLFTGYNRRFAPCVQALRKALADRATPLILNYRMNAGFIPKDHWIQGAEGGGRNLGEACHIYDLFIALVGSPVADVQAAGIGFGRGRHPHNDNFAATLRFEDGSIATLTYTSLGSKDFPKEHLEAYWDGRVARMEDYRSLEFFGTKAKASRHAQPEKGHYQEWLALTESLKSGAWAIPLQDQLAAAAVALQIETELSRG